jgi:hypothetical protein
VLIDVARAEQIGIPNPELGPFVYIASKEPEKAHFNKVVSDNPLRLYWLLANGSYKQSSEQFMFEVRGTKSEWQTSSEHAVFLPLDFDGSSVVLDWRDGAQASYWQKVDDDSVKGDILADYLDVDTERLRFRVKLPDSLGIGRREKIKVSLKLKTFSFSAGSSTRNWVTATVKKSNALATLYTILHELGHSIEQCVRDNSGTPGLPAKHPNQYVFKGHQGSHCNYGLSTRDQAKDDYKELVAAGTHGTCIMFGGVGKKTKFARAMRFCRHCEPYVKATKILSLIDR